MGYRIAADVLLVVHLAFILFVLFGGCLVLRWRRLAWVHLPLMAWGAFIEFVGWICPLTPLEDALRIRGGSLGHASSAAERYILPIVYPEGLTRGTQIVLGLGVLLINAGIYGWLIYRSTRRAAR